MLKKMALKNGLKLFKNGNFRVKFWDGEVVDYGENPDFTVIFNEEPKTKDMHSSLVLTIGEAYMHGILSFEGNLDSIISTMYKTNHHYYSIKELEEKLKSFASKDTTKLEEINQEKKNIHQHYDLGNDFYGKWLDPSLSYSCAYFKDTNNTLEEAQLNKIDHSLAKLNLHKGETLLDIGCGWGWLVIRAAQKYGVKAMGITLSEEQFKKGNERIKELGLENLVEIHLQNYIELDHSKFQFDKIVSIGMFEHVGQEHLEAYLAKVNLLLKDKGLFMLHSIMCQLGGPSNPWITQNIFPGGYIPTLRETLGYLPEMGYQVQHIENLRRHYAKTLDCWDANFQKCKEAVTKDYGNEFTRMWELYLKGCSSAFRTGNIDIYQILMSKGTNNNLPMTYEYMYK